MDTLFYLQNTYVKLLYVKHLDTLSKQIWTPYFQIIALTLLLI